MRPFVDELTFALPGLTVARRAVGELRPNPRNARKHTASQLAKVAASIKAFGFTAPIIVGTGDLVLAGHARLQAAIACGLEEVPVVSLAHLKPEEQRAYMIADNQLATLATWDEDILKFELEDLGSLDLNFTLEDLGFETAQLDLLLTDDAADGEDDPDDVVPEAAETPVTRLGDIWALGDHRLICGDSRDPQVFEALMGGEEARLMMADVPYNVKIRGHVAKRDSDAREFPMASGEMTPEEFTAFLTLTLGNAAGRCADGAISFVFIDWRHVGEVLTAGTAAIGEMKNVCVWAKQNAGMGAFYRSQHELIFVFKKGSAPHVNTFGLGGTGRYRTNLWNYPGASGFHADRASDLALHPTTKPVALIADAIRDVSRRGEIVLDPFAGSGSTLLAAERTHRRARLVELDPIYCDVICRRFIATGGSAVRVSDSKTFEQAAEAATT